MFKIALIVGGTNTKCALFEGNRIVKKIKSPTHVEKGKFFMIDNIIKMIENIKENKKISGIGMGVPGPIDRKRGVISNPPNIPWRNVPLKKIIQRKFRTKVAIENDAKCAALGVLARKKTKNFILFTLGTGVGGAIVTDGKLYTGMGNAGELGHVTIEKDGLKCNCGNMGCLEEYVAARGFERLAKKYFGKRLSPLELERMAKKGDKKAKRIYNEVGEYLGIGLANIGNAFNPETIYFTGKISRSGPLLLEPARKEMAKRIFVKPPKLKMAEEEAELYGAASLIK